MLTTAILTLLAFSVGFIAALVYMFWLEERSAKRNRDKFRLPAAHRKETRQAPHRPQLSVVASHKASPMKKVMP